MAIKKIWWGNHKGEDVFLFTISNDYLEVTLSNFGGTLISIMMPGDDGSTDNMILGYDSLEEYVNDPYYMGCIVGRFANRIANASFKIGSQKYQLAANEYGTGNHLHGGTTGFNKKVFAVSAEPFLPDQNALQFHYTSPDGEEGYPGKLEVDISYTLTDNNELVITYKASADQSTPVNLTSHCYFNLSGSKKNATDHELMINADNALAADHYYIPTGQIKPVKDSVLDFTKPRIINNSKAFEGYNDCFVLNHPDDSTTQAMLIEPLSGRTMIVKTTLPGIMLYTADHLGKPFQKNQGICLEAQFFPDSVNQPDFPNTILHPGDRYQHTTIYQFK